MDCCLSPHEQLLANNAEGIDNPLRSKEAHSRALKFWNGSSTSPRKWMFKEGNSLTEVMKETEGQPLVLRWAKAMMHVAKNIDVYIDEDQLLVGRAGAQGRYGILHPELDGDFLDLAVKQLKTRKVSPFVIEPEDADVIINEIAPFWKGKTFHEMLAKSLPEETLKMTYDPEDELLSRYIVNETASFRSSLQWVHDYEKVLKIGFKGIRNIAQEKLDALDPFSPKDNCEKKPFLTAITIICDAVCLWARRHAELAAEMAEEETDPQRKAELEMIADACAHVPENPARNFREAMQSQWFTQMFSRIEQKTGTIISNGRMDQYLYPFYKKMWKPESSPMTRPLNCLSACG